MDEAGKAYIEPSEGRCVLLHALIRNIADFAEVASDHDLQELQAYIWRLNRDTRHEQMKNALRVIDGGKPDDTEEIDGGSAI